MFHIGSVLAFERVAIGSILTEIDGLGKEMDLKDAFRWMEEGKGKTCDDYDVVCTSKTLFLHDEAAVAVEGHPRLLAPINNPSEP